MKKQLTPKTLQKADFPLWDAFVDQSPQGDVFCYMWWLDAVTKGNFKILAIFENDEILAGIPLAYYSGKINEPPLTRTLGPLFKPLPDFSGHDRTTIERRWLNLLLDEIPLDDFEQFCTSHHFTDWLPFRWRGLQQTTRYTYLLGFQNKSIDDLWHALNENKKRDIKKAIKNNITVNLIDDAHLFYQLVEQTYQRQGLKFRFKFDDFNMLDDAINNNNSRKIFLASDKSGQHHAAVYVAHTQKSAYYLLAGNIAEFLHSGGGTLALWEAIKYFHPKVDYFNFGGSDIERIEQYVRGFGGEARQYFRISKDHPQIREVEKVIEKEVVKEVPVIPPPPPDNWKYHVELVSRHGWALIKKALYKLHIRFNLPVRVSVIVPCYNHGSFIHEMLQSVFKQTYPFYEVIIVNDGSTDDTAKILNRINHKKVRIIHTLNHGPAHARNLAITNAKGDLIINLDADNKIAPDFLERCIKIMDNHPNVGIVYSQVECFGAKTGIYKIPEYSFENMLRNNCIDGNACFRKSDWERTEGYRINMHYGYEDFDFWLSILELGRDVFKIEQIMVYYRTHDDPAMSRSGKRKINPHQMETVIVQAFRNHREYYKGSPHIYEEFCALEKQFERKNYPDSVNSQYPTFSIITPTNKRADLLKRNIDSIRKQSFQDWEQIVVDDANDPETRKLIESYADSRIRYFFHKAPKGAAGSRNTGLKNAYGKYINYLDDDDEFLDDTLIKIKHCFDSATNNPGFVWTGITRVRDADKGEEELRTAVWPSDFINPVQGLKVSTAIGIGFGVTMHRNCIKTTGLHDETFKVSSDTDFMIKLSKYFNFRTVPEVLVKVHHHEKGQLTHHRNKTFKKESYGRILTRHHRFLVQNWDIYYMHHAVYTGLCFQINKKRAGFHALFRLIKLFPNRRIAWLDLLSFLLEGKDYKSGMLKRRMQNHRQSRKQKKEKTWRKQSIKRMDIYRKNYDKMTFATLTKTANEWLHMYPEQASYTLPLVIRWFEKYMSKPARIIEIGGWRGDLAGEILSRYPHVACWHNYDLISDDSTQKCSDERYRLIPLSDYIWNLQLPADYNALIASHVIEHLKWWEVKLLIRWIPDWIETILFEIPIAESAENYNWKGHHSTHILEKGWKQVIDEMSASGFEVVLKEQDTVIFKWKK